nr:hypothetical protein [uncultured Marinifilum sp.]
MLTQIVKIISTKIKLSQKVKEAEDTYTFKFAVTKNIKWAPGAYAHFVSSDLENGEKVKKKESIRELSIMSHSNEKFIGFTTRIRQNPSEFKQMMLNLEIGDEIRMFKIGNHLKKQKTDKPIVLISMGVGIATFRPIILEYIEKVSQKVPITNINIDRSGNFVYQKELENLPDNKIKNVFVTQRDDLYKSIDRCIDNQENKYFVVGSKEFNKAIGDYLIKKNVSDKEIIFDKH